MRVDGFLPARGGPGLLGDDTRAGRTVNRASRDCPARVYTVY